jgi:serine/threonine protein kinase
MVFSQSRQMHKRDDLQEYADEICPESFHTSINALFKPESLLEGPIEGVVIRDLDTGQMMRLDEDAVLPECLTSAKASLHQLSGTPWQSWWSEKKRKDERLWSAVENGDMADLNHLLAPSTDGSPDAGVNSRSLYGRTALHMCMEGGRSDMVEAILRAQADVCARTDEGMTALHIASQCGHFDATRMLLVARAEVNAGTIDSSTPLHLAAAKGRAATVWLLLQHGGQQQLCIRNCLGQRAADVSFDTATLLLIQAAERSHVHSSDSHNQSATEVVESERDCYAGRTLFADCSVLSRNSRVDTVRRLLQKAQHLPDAVASGLHAPLSCNGQNLRRPPFTRVRSSSTGVEPAGPDSFELVKFLGKGSFGRVLHVRHKRTQQDYAMKILQKRKATNGSFLRYTMTERNILSYIRHPYIVSLHYAFQTPKQLVLVLKFCPGGTLQQLIKRAKSLGPSLACLYAAEVLLALCHLHCRHIVFRDLKPDNIVLDAERHCLLTDFGLSKEGVEGLDGAQSFCGSLAFLAPEIVLRQGHGHTVDIYGLGVLLYTMLVGMPPFFHHDRHTLLTNIKKAPLQIPVSVQRDAAKLITSLMARRPRERLGAQNTADVKEHAFFEDIDFDALLRCELSVPHAPESSPVWSLREKMQAGLMSPPAVPGQDEGLSFGGDGAQGAVSAKGAGRSRQRDWDGPSKNIKDWEFSSAAAA